MKKTATALCALLGLAGCACVVEFLWPEYSPIRPWFHSVDKAIDEPAAASRGSQRENTVVRTAGRQNQPAATRNGVGSFGYSAAVLDHSSSGEAGAQMANISTRNNFVHAQRDSKKGTQGPVNRNIQQSVSLYFKVKNTDLPARDEVLRLVSDVEAEQLAILKESVHQGLGGTEASALRSAAMDRFQKGIIGTLGEQDGEYFLDLFGASPFVPLAEDFARTCSDRGIPIDPSTVAAITLDLKRNLQNPAFPHPDLRTSAGIPVNESKAFEQARTLLTPPQMELFKQYWATRPFPKIPGR